MTAIPRELLAAIAQPVGSDNVLRMFMQGQQQELQNEEAGWQRKRRNVLLESGRLIEQGQYRKAGAALGGIGDTTAAQHYISMAEQQERDKRLKQWLEPQLGMGGAQPAGSSSGYEPPAGGYRGTIGGDGRPRMEQASPLQSATGRQMPQSMLRMGSQPRGNVALARAHYANGDTKSAIEELYRDKSTPDMLEYQLAQEQGYAGTFRQYQLEMKKAGGTHLTIDQKGLSAEEESAGKERGARMDALESGKSISSLQQIQLAGRLLQNVDSGALAGLKGKAGNIAASLGLPKQYLPMLGIDPELVTTGPQIQALINRQVVGMIGSGQFPAQNFSDTDRIFLEKILPSLANQPEANKLITATTERLLEIETQKRQEWAQARKQGTTFRDFEADWNDRLAATDLFGDIAKQAGADGAGGWSEVPGMPGVTIRKREQ